MAEVYQRLLASLFAELCPRCGFTTAAGFCAACRAEFTQIEQPCRRCGLPEPVARCPRMHMDWQVDGVHAPLAYKPPLSSCIQDMKFGRRRTLARALGLMLAERSADRADRIDRLAPVPLHRSRLRERGFNQADEIARTIRSVVDRKLIVSGISRIVCTRAQSDLKPAARIDNVRRAFRARRSLDGMRIAIIDDVITTGATVNSLASELRARGASYVEVWAVARAVGRDQARNR